MGHNCCQKSSTEGIKTAFFLNVGFAIIELIGGVLTNSVSIMSDAIHDIGDSISLGVSWYLERKSHRGATEEYSYGYRRLSLLSSIINSVILFVGSLFIIKEAVERLFTPEAVQAEGMLFLAILGVLVNGFAVYRLKKSEGWNTKSVRLHLFEDMIGRGAVLVASIILIFYDIPWLDSALGIAIALYVLKHAWKILQSTISLFLQKVPKGIDLKLIEKDIKMIDHVKNVHHIHFRSLDGENNVFTCHVTMGEFKKQNVLNVKKTIKEKLTKYKIKYSTIEIDISNSDCSQKE